MTESQDARILFWFQKVKQLEKENEALKQKIKELEKPTKPLKQKIKELEKPTKPHLSMCERCGEDKDTVILCWGKDDEVYLCCGDCYSR